jgi:hypothetical protein
VSANQQGAIMAVLSLIVALATAIVLHTGAAGAAIVNLAQGVLALFLAFGLHMAPRRRPCGCSPSRAAWPWCCTAR